EIERVENLFLGLFPGDAFRAPQFVQLARVPLQLGGLPVVEDQDVGQRNPERGRARADLPFVPEDGDSGDALFGDFRRGDDRAVVPAFRQNNVLEAGRRADPQFFQDVHRYGNREFEKKSPNWKNRRWDGRPTTDSAEKSGDASFLFVFTLPLVA